jgi:hypothetical protein
MAVSPLRCPKCQQSAVLIVVTPTRRTDAPSRRRSVTLDCPSGCTTSEAHLARLADPMAC